MHALPEAVDVRVTKRILGEDAAGRLLERGIFGRRRHGPEPSLGRMDRELQERHDDRGGDERGRNRKPPTGARDSLLHGLEPERRERDERGHEERIPT